MKLLFTADLHIKLGQKNVPIDWAKNRYYNLFDQINKHCIKADMLVLGGDIFDKTPTMEELEVFFDFVSSISIPTICYSGNHEAVKRDTTFLSQLKRTCSRLNSNFTIIDDFYSINNIDFIPYNVLKQYNPADIDFHGDILCTHVRGEIPPHVKPEIDLSLLSRWKIVLAGDLHSHSNSQRNIIYPGSPITTSFHRELVDTGLIIIDTITFNYDWIKIETPQLLKKTVNTQEEMIPTKYHHTIYEVEGNMVELAEMQDNDLIAKRVIKRETDTSLILNPDMGLAKEVEEYLRYILQLEDKEIEEVLKELPNYAK